MREREDAHRTREAGHLDEIQGAVANTLDVFRNGPACSRMLSELASSIGWMVTFDFVQQKIWTLSKTGEIK
jgi:hypothetical protein